MEKLRTANISSSAAASVANDNDDSTHNNSLAASIARKNAAQNKDEVTETAKAAATFAATAALYSHSGLNAVPNSGGKNTNKSSTSEVSSGTTSKSGGQTPAAALCVDDESDQGQVFRTPVLVVSDHPDALSSSDEDKELDGEGSMQNALDRVFFGDDDEDEVDSPSGFGTTTTKTRGENKMSYFNALPPYCSKVGNDRRDDHDDSHTLFIYSYEINYSIRTLWLRVFTLFFLPLSLSLFLFFFSIITLTYIKPFCCSPSLLLLVRIAPIGSVLEHLQPRPDVLNVCVFRRPGQLPSQKRALRVRHHRQVSAIF